MKRIPKKSKFIYVFLWITLFFLLILLMNQCNKIEGLGLRNQNNNPIDENSFYTKLTTENPSDDIYNSINPNQREPYSYAYFTRKLKDPYEIKSIINDMEHFNNASAITTGYKLFKDKSS